MERFRRYLLTALSLLALAGFGAQIVRGVATGTAFPCSVSGSCRIK